MLQSGCRLTRTSANIIRVGGYTFRTVENLSKFAPTGKVAKATLERATNADWRRPTNHNSAIVGFCCGRVLGVDVAEEYGEHAVDQDRDYATGWFALHAIRQTIDRTSSLQQEERTALMEKACSISRGALNHGKPKSLVDAVFQAAALTHLSGNTICVDQTEREDRRQQGIELIHDHLIRTIGDDYSGGDLVTLLDPKEFVTSSENDLSGFLLSTALHYLNSLAAGGGTNVWREEIQRLQTNGLMAQLVVRGIQMKEPITLINAAEVYFVLSRTADDFEQVKAILAFIRLYIDPNAVAALELMTPALEADFVAFANPILR